jgi:hypothetical protein
MVNEQWKNRDGIHKIFDRIVLINCVNYCIIFVVFLSEF